MTLMELVGLDVSVMVWKRTGQVPSADIKEPGDSRLVRSVR